MDKQFDFYIFVYFLTFVRDPFFSLNEIEGARWNNADLPILAIIDCGEGVIASSAKISLGQFSIGTYQCESYLRDRSDMKKCPGFSL